MLYKELFTGDNQLFGGIFYEKLPVVYEQIFGGMDVDSFALMKFGNRTVLDSFTKENCRDLVGGVLDLCVDAFKSQFDVFTKQYDFLNPLIQSTSTDKSVTVQETNSDGITKSEKAFNDGDFNADSKEDKSNDKSRTETEKTNIQRSGFNGNVTQAMLDEYRARLTNVREDIINNLVGYLTLSIYE